MSPRVPELREAVQQQHERLGPVPILDVVEFHMLKTHRILYGVRGVRFIMSIEDKQIDMLEDQKEEELSIGREILHVTEDRECGKVDTEPEREPDSTKIEYYRCNSTTNTDECSNLEIDESSQDSTLLPPNEILPLKPNILTPKKFPQTHPVNPSLLKPFESGWKREMVYRNPTGDNKRRVDVYYYTPSGKKLRSLKNIAEHLEGTGLTLDNFSFTRAPLGINDPDKEIVRNAKRSSSYDSCGSSKKKKQGGKCSPDSSGTPRVVLKNGEEGGDGVLQGREDLDEETCSWLPPMWSKLLSILNRQS